MSGSYTKSASIPSSWIYKSPRKRLGIGESQPEESVDEDILTRLDIGYTVAYGLYEVSDGSVSVPREPTLGTGPILLDPNKRTSTGQTRHGYPTFNAADAGIGLIAAYGDCTTIEPGSGDWCISVWAYKISGGPDFLLSFGQPTSDFQPESPGEEGLVMAINVNDPIYCFYGGGGQFREGSNLDPYVTNAWNHVVITVDRSNNIANHYLNGELQNPGTSLATAGDFSMTSAGFAVGSSYGNTLYPWHSNICDIIIWKGGVWTYSQVRTLYNFGAGIDLTI